MTNGLFAAVEAKSRDGSDGDTRRPIYDCQKMKVIKEFRGTYNEGTGKVD